MHQPLALTIGVNARAARLRASLTQAQVAEALGVPASLYGRIERGKLLPTPRMLHQLAEVLHVSVEVLIGERAPERPTPEASNLLRALQLAVNGVDDAQLQQLLSSSERTRH